ncbi:hypothetical protein Pd630_LPD02520 [Rhodococcus opacus PD630]|nr:hypothetical protein Pd630_LPD02520 [Rhodococcus opacus PD630]
MSQQWPQNQLRHDVTSPMFVPCSQLTDVGVGEGATSEDACRTVCVGGFG